MPQINNFPGGFAAGITIRGMPVAVTHPGKVFWVSNATTLSDRQIGGSNSNNGTFDKPFATIAGALTNCVASRGDIVFVKPGHVETITAAAGIVLNKAGVAIIGLGQGSLRPTINYTTANTASMTVTASNVTLSNFLFTANFLNIATAISIANAQVAKELTIDNCEFRDTSSVLNFLVALSVGTTANIADGLAFTNNKVIALASSGVIVAVKLASIVDRLVISGNFVSGVGIVDQPSLVQLGTSLNHTNLQIFKNVVVNPATSSTNGLAVGGSGTMTGICYDNYIYMLDNTAGIWIPTGLGLGFINNYAMITGAADKSALINPAAV